MQQISSGETFGKRIYKALNRPRSAKYQDARGTYGKRTRVSLKHFEHHLKGNDSIALSAVDGEKANFLAIDVDHCFEERLTVFADILAKRGMENSAFAINGSSHGRGKIVITLGTRLPQRQAVRLVQGIADEAVADDRFGSYKAKDLTTFPQGGDGGHVRIFGRNLKRVQARVLTEAPLHLNGDLSDLYYLQPADVVPLGRAKMGAAPALSEWAKAFISEPYVGGTHDLFRLQSRLAHEALRVHGNAGALEFLTDAFHGIEERSPDLNPSARRSLLRCDTVARILAYASASHKEHVSISGLIRYPRNNIDASKPAARVYRALCEYVTGNGLDPVCFGMTFDRIADIVGYVSKGKAREALLRAVDAGLVVRVDAGLPREPGRNGLCGLYALVGEHHNTPLEAFHEAARTDMYRERSDERVRRRLDPLPCYEEIGTAA